MSKHNIFSRLNYQCILLAVQVSVQTFKLVTVTCGTVQRDSDVNANITASPSRLFLFAALLAHSVRILRIRITVQYVPVRHCVVPRNTSTRVNEGRAFSLVSAGNRLPRSDKIAGTTHPVSVIEVCHDGFVLHPCNRHIVNSEIAVAKNETIKVERERRHRCLQA